MLACETERTTWISPANSVSSEYSLTNTTKRQLNKSSSSFRALPIITQKYLFKMLPAMHLKTYIFVIFFAFTLVITGVSCLQCHVCSSIQAGQEDCHDVASSDKKYLQMCQEPANASCRIQEQWIEFEVLKQSHDKRVIRQCASTEFDSNRPCYYRAGFGGKTNVCNCIGDGCNSASRTASALFMTIGTFILLKMLL